MSLIAASASSLKNFPDPKIISYLVLSKFSLAVMVLFERSCVALNVSVCVLPFIVSWPVRVKFESSL